MINFVVAYYRQYRSRATSVPLGNKRNRIEFYHLTLGGTFFFFIHQCIESFGLLTNTPI